MKYKPKTLGHRGFTLTEIMIAMGVLAVGMAMIAGALHAGISLHKRTIDDIIRLMVADNSIAIIQCRVRHSKENGITEDLKMLGPIYFGSKDLKYPTGSIETPYGSVVFMSRRLIPADANNPSRFANDYHIVIIPYCISPAVNSEIGNVNSTSFSCTIESGITSSTTGTTITAPANILKVGSPIIDTRNERVKIYFIQSTPTLTTAELSETIPVGNNVELTTLIPTIANNRIECNIPVQTKTALSPEPGWKPE